MKIFEYRGTDVLDCHSRSLDSNIMDIVRSFDVESPATPKFERSRKLCQKAVMDIKLRRSGRFVRLINSMSFRIARVVEKKV